MTKIHNHKTKFSFLVVSQDQKDGEMIGHFLKREKQFGVVQVETLRETLEKISQGGTKCVVFNLRHFDLKSAKFVIKLRDIYPAIPIIVVAKDIVIEAIQSVKKISRTVVIERESSDRELLAISRKIIGGKEVHQRNFKRFATDQRVIIERILRNDSVNGFVYNLSQGGAFMALDVGSVKPGELIRINVRLDRLKKVHTLYGKVVWTSAYNLEGVKTNASQHAGLRFVQMDEVYSNLLEQV